MNKTWLKMINARLNGLEATYKELHVIREKGLPTPQSIRGNIEDGILGVYKEIHRLSFARNDIIVEEERWNF